MSSYPRLITANFGPLYAGVAGQITYSVKSQDGLTTYIPQTGTGVGEIVGGTGAYSALPNFDTTWGFVLVFWIGPNSVSVAEVIDAGADNAVTPPSTGGSTLQATFDPSIPTTKDALRERVGDVSSSPQWFLDDRTIAYWLTNFTFEEACARAAESIGAQCIQLATTIQQRNLKLSYQSRSRQAFELADRIRNQADPEPGEPLRFGADSADMRSPHLAGYIAGLGVRLDDPNFCR